MKSFVYAGLVFMLAGAGALFVCRRTINELSGVGVAFVLLVSGLWRSAEASS